MKFPHCVLYFPYCYLKQSAQFSRESIDMRILVVDGVYHHWALRRCCLERTQQNFAVDSTLSTIAFQLDAKAGLDTYCVEKNLSHVAKLQFHWNNFWKIKLSWIIRLWYLWRDSKRVKLVIVDQGDLLVIIMWQTWDQVMTANKTKWFENG